MKFGKKNLFYSHFLKLNSYNNRFSSSVMQKLVPGLENDLGDLQLKGWGDTDLAPLTIGSFHPAVVAHLGLTVWTVYSTCKNINSHM